MIAPDMSDMALVWQICSARRELQIFLMDWLKRCWQRYNEYPSWTFDTKGQLFKLNLLRLIWLYVRNSFEKTDSTQECKSW